MAMTHTTLIFTKNNTHTQSDLLPKEMILLWFNTFPLKISSGYLMYIALGDAYHKQSMVEFSRHIMDLR